jgi:hypothetical protein
VVVGKATGADGELAVGLATDLAIAVEVGVGRESGFEQALAVAARAAVPASWSIRRRLTASGWPSGRSG